MKIKKLNQNGFSHDLVIILFVLIFAIGGTAYLVGSHADTPTSGNNTTSTTPTGPPYNSQYVTINPTSATVVLNRANQNLGVIPPGSQFGGADIFAVGFNISNHYSQPIQYSMPNFSLNVLKGGVKKGLWPDANFLNPSGRLFPGQHTNVVLYINPDNFNNGLYQYSSVVTYIVPASSTSPQHTVTGPNVVFTASLVGPEYESYFTVDTPLQIADTLSKSNANASGQVIGQGFSITGVQPSNIRFKYKVPTPPNTGLTPATAALSPHQATSFSTYANTSVTDGVYNGSAIIQYQNSRQNWVDGPTVNYGINLTN
jgi:hypothetical protein